MEIQNNVSSILQKYKDHMDRQQELDELLLTNQDREAWIACLQNRAVENQQMYEENGQLISALEAILQKELTEDSAKELYEEVNKMYWDGYDDCEILLPILYKLIDYYETHENVVNLLFLYGAAYYEENEVQNRREGRKVYNEAYNFKILEYKKVYADLPTAAVRKRIWGAYYNLIVVGLGNKMISPDESCRYYREAMEFWNSPEVQALDAESAEIIEVVERINNEWLIVEENIESASRETKEVFCRVAKEAYDSQVREKENLLDVNSEVYAAYLHAQFLMGEKNLDAIVDEYFSYYNEKLKLCPDAKEMTDEDFYFIINTPLAIERWLEYGVAEDKAKQIMAILKRETQATWYQKFGKYASSFVNEILAEWCFKLMKYLDSQNEKEEWLFQLLVRRQLPTYLHSVMVMHLAEALCKEVSRSRAELFASLPEEYRSDLLEFVRQCALLHDVGKTRITDIVNTQGRRLWDREFEGIKMHPVYGAEMLSSDPDLAKYRDVALGHHKFYDGNGGYPDNFQNTESEYRIIIDLITICDCMDAATDHLGRNYKRAKTLDAVLEELIEGKGHRYNPDLVEVIENSPRLKKELGYIVSEGRLDIMYRAYLESVL